MRLQCVYLKVWFICHVNVFFALVWLRCGTLLERMIFTEKTFRIFRFVVFLFFYWLISMIRLMKSLLFSHSHRQEKEKMIKQHSTFFVWIIRSVTGDCSTLATFSMHFGAGMFEILMQQAISFGIGPFKNSCFIRSIFVSITNYLALKKCSVELCSVLRPTMLWRHFILLKL